MKSLRILASILLLCAVGLVFYLLQVDRTEKIQSLAREAGNAMDTGRWEAARGLVEEAVRINSDHPLSLYLQARLKVYRDGDLQEAAPLVASIEDPSGFSPSQFYHLSLAAMDTDQVDLGKTFLKSFEEAYPGHPLLLKANGIFFMQEENYEEAMDLFQEAYDQGLDDPQIKLILARFYRESESVTDRIQAKTLYREMAEEPTSSGFSAYLELLGSDRLPKSEEETLHYLDAIAEHPYFRSENNAYLRDPDYARPLIARLSTVRPEAAMHACEQFLESESATWEDRVLAARIFLLNQALPKARELIASMAKTKPEDPEVQVLSTFLLFLESGYEEAFQKIEEYEMAGNDSDTVIDMARFVLNNRSEDLAPSEMNHLLDFIINHPNSGPNLKLSAWSERIRMEPLKKEALYREAISSMEAYPLELAQWLNREKRYSDTIELLSEVNLVESREFYSPLFLALLQTGNYKQAETLLHRMEDSLNSDQRYLSRLLYARKTENDSLFRQTWEEAFQYSRESVNLKLALSLADFAHQAGEEESAYQAYKFAFKNNYLPSPQAWARAFSYCHKRESAEFIKEMATRAAEKFPENPVFANNLAYVSFLLNQDSEKYFERMENLVNANPDFLPYRMTLGLGFLRQGKPEEALRLVQDLDLNWNEQSDQTRMLMAVILAANERRAFANSFVENINSDRLMASEQKLLAQFFPDFTGN